MKKTIELPVVRSSDAIENDIHFLLKVAWNNFLLLKSNHPSHTPKFLDGIHQCQQILMWRECQRKNPDKYPIYETN